MGLALTGPVDLEDLTARKDLSWTCDAATGRHVIRAGAATIAFAPGIARATVNGSLVALSAPPAVLGGRLKVPADLAKLVLDNAADRARTPDPAIAKPAPSPEPKPRPAAAILPIRIVIDAGHGGMHTGYEGRTGLLEKDVNLAVSLELQRILESWGARVTMTRTTDRHFSPVIDNDLQERVDIVNRASPDLFLSIHANGADNVSARGFEVWVPMNARGERDRESRRLAQNLLAGLDGAWGNAPNRGVKDDRNLRVLRGTTCPAALVELEFVSNRAAEKELSKPQRRDELASSIADAVRRWAQAR
ncbi:MAG TPA: N-acetylmuramoyl-L-alanine amidase [Planctomycetota bacterium]